MSKLNARREIPYDFHTVEFEGIIHLFDNSTDTYICSQVKQILVEPFCSTGEEEPSRRAYYLTRNSVERLSPEPLEMREEDVAHDVEEFDAWESARAAARAKFL